jgi:hypothetical protein
MNAPLEEIRSNPAAVAPAVAAGIAFTACALVAIAYFLGWLPSKPSLPSSPASMANPGQQVAGSAPDVALLPGETLVAPPDAVASPQSAAPVPSATPQPTPGQPKVAVPPASAPRKPALYPQPVPSPAPGTYAPALPSRAAPSKPNYTREELPRYTAYERSTRELCVNCGAITSIVPAGPDWEVRVRFDDGSSETLRYAERPPLRTGDRVHLEEGRLIAH